MSSEHTPTISSHQQQEGGYDSDFMSNFSPSLVHRIMLTPPPSSSTNRSLDSQHSFHNSRQPTITFRKVLLQEGFLSNTPPPHVESKQQQTRTPNDDDDGTTIDAPEGPRRRVFFQQRPQEESSSPSLPPFHPSPSPIPLHESISRTMMRAFHDVLLSQLSQSQNYHPLLDIVLDIQSKLKSLIPHRTDLHEKFQLDLDQVKRCLETFQGTLKLLCDFAQRLIQLESEERSVSTQDWIHVAMDIQQQLQQERQPQLQQEQIDGDSASGGQEPIVVTFFCREEDSNEQDDTMTMNNDVHAEDTVPARHRIQLCCKKFVVASVYFVHGKIVQCQSDIADFQFEHFLAPKIRAHGIEFLKRDFEQRFGSFDSLLRKNDVQVVVPNMKVWLMEMIESCSVDTTEERQAFLTLEEKRVKTLIQRGWVDNILFRSPRTVESEQGRGGYDGNGTGNNEESVDNHGQGHGHGHEKHNTSGKFYMPEIFYLDAAEVKEIRLVTKISVVGSALALHATNIAGAKDNVLRQDPLPHKIQQCRTKLIHAMGNRAIGRQELYEQAVGDAVVELARELNPHFECNAAQEDILRSRTAATMRGEDPVINLLDSRMRDIFRKMMVFNPLEQGQVPSTLRTGRDVTHGSRVYIDMSSGMYAETLHQASKEEFINKGFSFYADELAEATVMSHTMISLAMKIHGTWVDKMFLDLIQHKM